MPKEPIISSRIRLTGKTSRWRQGPEYQDSTPNAAGWLQMRSDDGRVLSFSDVVAIDGFDGPEGKYLVVEEGTYP